jgi:hypothetical protein
MKNENKLKTIFKFTGWFLCLFSILIALWLYRDSHINKLVERRQEQLSSTILKTIEDQAKPEAIMPDMVFVNIDSLDKQRIIRSVKKRIVTVLTKKYLDKKPLALSDKSFKPFFIYPDLADKDGNYSLTKLQLEELRSHMIFLTAQVDRAVSATKEEIDRDISRISIQVGICLAIVGFLGIFIPIVINYKFNSDLKELETSANTAKATASEAKKSADQTKILIDGISAEVDKVKNIPNELKDLQGTFDSFKSDVGQAKTNATEALTNATEANKKATKVEKLVSTLNDISKIKDIDATFLLYNKQPLDTLKSYLSEIHLNLSNCNEIFDAPIIKDVFRQLALKLHLLAPFSFISPQNFDLLNEFSQGLSNIISIPITNESYATALNLLEDLKNKI